MKNNSVKLSRDEMKKIKGGGIFYLWSCELDGVNSFQCSNYNLNPYLRCGYTACIITSTLCSNPICVS